MDGARGAGQPQIRVVRVVGVTVYACVIYATEAIGGGARGPWAERHPSAGLARQ